LPPALAGVKTADPNS